MTSKISPRLVSSDALSSSTGCSSREDPPTVPEDERTDLISQRVRKVFRQSALASARPRVILSRCDTGQRLESALVRGMLDRKTLEGGKEGS